MTVQDAIVQRITDKMMRMRAALERFDNETAEQTMVGPKWNVRDLVGHFVFWTSEGAEQVKAVARGEPAKQYDDDRVNDEVFRRNRRMMYAMLLPQLRSAEEQFLDAVKGLRAEQLGPDERVRKCVDAFGAEHYDRHWPSLKQAVAAAAR